MSTKKILCIGYGYVEAFTKFGVVTQVHYDDSEDDNIYKDIDLVVFTGGTDLSTSLYNRKPIKIEWPNKGRDYYETVAYYKALERGIPMVGICRGMQFLTAMTGGVLAQDIYHPSTHDIHTFDGKILPTNSMHHQMCVPKEGTYKLIAWAEGISSYYKGVTLDELIRKEDGVVLEPEALYFPQINSFGVQYHPECMQADHPAKRLFNVGVSNLLS